MPNVQRLKLTWTGWTGAPGRTTMHFSDAVAAQSVVDITMNFLVDVLSSNATAMDRIPLGVQISADSVVDLVDAATGDITGQVGITPGPNITGTGGQNWVGVAGACVTWLSGAFINGHRIVGRNFLVPLAMVCYGTDGTLDNTFRSELAAAAATYITNVASLVVLRRAKPAANGKPAVVGESHPATAARVTDQASYLSTRRT
jgi:hypothetical protein